MVTHYLIGDKFYKQDDVVNGKPKADATALTQADAVLTASPYAAATTGLLNLAGSVQSNALTVADAMRMGWVVSATGNDYANHVRNADQVNFIGLGDVDVAGRDVTDSTGRTTRTIEVSVDAPISYNEIKSGDDTVVKGNDGKWYKEADLDDEGYPVDGATAVDADTIVKTGAILSDANSDALNNPYQTALEIVIAANPNATAEEIVAKVTAEVEAMEKAEKAGANKDVITAGSNGVQLNNVGWAENPDQVVNKDQLDQTVNKSGFFIQQNGTSTVASTKGETDPAKSEKVTPNDLVNFTDGKDTTVVAETRRNDDGVDTTTISVDVKSANSDTLTVDNDGIKVNTGSLVNATTTEGDVNRGKVTVNAGDDNKVATVKNVADAINSAAWTVKVADTQEEIATSTSNDKGLSVSAGTEVTQSAGKNLKVKREGNNVTYALANDVSVNSVTSEKVTVGSGDAATTVTTSKAADNVTEVNFGDNAGNPVRITNIADGVKDGDAVTVRQLNEAKAANNQNAQAIGNLNNKIDQVDKRNRKGTTIAGAIGMLPQPHISGKSMVGVATTNYRGQQAVAVGYSRLSDNGKHIIKLSGSSNVSGKKDAMVGAAYGFQW